MKFTREILHDRHRLSHQQIDRWLGENRSSEFLNEKLIQLEQVRKFLAVTDKLRQHQIPFICIKGPLLSCRIYRDPSVRISHDIDLLVNPNDLEKILELLEAENFRLTPGTAWPDKKFKKELLMNVTHHVSLWNNLQNFCVELHWTLIYRLPLSQQEIKKILQQNLTTITLAGQAFTVLNKELELLYLIIHGARHGWSRLKWLADIHDYPLNETDETKFCELVEQFRAERLVTQTNFFLKEQFNDGQKLPDPWEKRLPPRMVRYVCQSIDQPVIDNEFSTAKIIQNFQYTWFLFPGWQYKRQWLSGIFVREGDLLDLDLPSKTAYFLYRPWSYIKRRILHV